MLKRLAIMSAISPVLGGTTFKVPEERLCRLLALCGEENGWETTVFHPAAYNPSTGQIDGITLHNGAWVRHLTSAPHIVYDRHFSRDAGDRAAAKHTLQQLKLLGSPALNGSPLPGKREVYRKLAGSQELRSLIPPTYLLSPGSERLLNGMLARFPDGVFMKPTNGMQGKGTIAIQHLPLNGGGYLIKGRSSQNKPYTLMLKDRNRLLTWVGEHSSRRPYLLQPLLSLLTAAGDPYDVRVLVQKDGNGHWRISGTAVRKGAPGTMTANLHGGGSAHPLSPFLTMQFGNQQAVELKEHMTTSALLTARILEQSYGRFAELGLDFGIEPDGRLWFIEANSKPGRTFFRRLGDTKGELRSVSWLLQYAWTLCRQSALRRGKVVNPAADAYHKSFHS
ncbi:YheC/YheD family endospore coat-associated protein [Paenibacillus tarimensis]|uniref:YheC/YheD family endospore coat-associated protein n=1 Tax=Paenibacillus tarimensis TaxID=416012 RepID=UPI001F1B5F89|nr:YheC/YheD family protein [Paenibacillus tarimensis]MCF2943879.1 YheC/YheD family protein [Paenibacillus tarimensis]